MDPTGIEFSRRDLLRYLGAGAGAAALGGLTSCMPSTGGSADAGGGSGGGSANRVHFTSWSLNEEASKPVIRHMLDEYSAQKGVEVSTASYPYDAYLKQLVLQARGGQITGAAQLDITWLAALAAMGKLVDLGAAANSVDYTDSSLASGQVDGVQYGLPWITGSIGMIANTALLEQAGVSRLPTTIKEFEAALEAVKGLGDDVIPYAGMTKVDQLKDILMWMQTFGSPLVEGSDIRVGDQASVDAVAWYKSIYNRGYLAPDMNRFDARALFAQGRAAFYDDAVVAKGILTSETKDKNFLDKITPMPRPTQGGGDPVARLWGHLIVVFQGDGAEAATDFATYLTSDEDAVSYYFKKLSLPPTTESALNSQLVRKDEWVSTWTERITSTATPGPFWAFPESDQMIQKLAEQVQAVLVGQAKPADAMAAARQQIQQLV